METISIRNLRGSVLQELARSGEPLGISNHRVLVGVMIPVAAAWVEHLIDYNWSQLRHDIDTGERAMQGPMPLVTLDSAVAEADATDDKRQAARVPQLAGTVAAAVVSGAVEQDPG